MLSDHYLAHGFCYLWDARLVALHADSDSLIFLAYMAISITLGVILYRERRQLPFAPLAASFGVFILACGLTHAMDVVVLWHPWYWVSGGVKLVTAVSSVVTATVLPFFVGRVSRVLAEARSSRRNERRFLAASESSHDSVFILESVRNGAGEILDFRFAFANAQGARLLSSTPALLTGKLLCQSYPLNRSDGFFEKFKHIVETGEELDEEFPIDDEKINASWLHHHVRRLDDGVAIATRNISARKQSEAELAALATFRRSIFASSPFATIATNSDGVITAFNPAAERMLGYRSEALVDRETPLILLEAQELARRAAALGEELHRTIEPGMAVLQARPALGMVEEAEWRLIRSDGTHVEAQLAINALTDDRGEAIGLILLAYDITERKRNEAQLSYIAHHDALTGLPTRTLLYDRLTQAISRASRNGRRLAVLMIDFDDFKRVNDLLGHAAGDELLIAIAARLRSRVRESDTVARMGGDEFVILLDEVNHVEDAERIATELLRELAKPVALGLHSVSQKASIGICVYPDNGDHLEALFRNADAAMYQAKADGGNGFRTFADGLAALVSDRRHLVHRFTETKGFRPMPSLPPDPVA